MWIVHELTCERWRERFNLCHLNWSSPWTFSEQMHWLSDQLSLLDFFVIQPQPAGKEPIHLTVYVIFFFPKVSVPEHICVCVHHVLTLNSSLWVTNAPECVPPPPTDESHEEEVVHHLTIHSFTCRVKRKIESEWWKWTAVKRTTFYFAAGLTALNSLKTGDGCHHKKKSAQSCFLFL